MAPHKLRSLYEEADGFGVLLTMAHEWQPKETWRRAITLLAHEVMPKLADLC